MFLVICYSVHRKCVASVDSFDNYESAADFLKKDAENTYQEELNNDSENVDLTLDDDGASLLSFDGEYYWTWEIVQI